MIVLCAETPSGKGLSAVSIASKKDPRVNGFRPGHAPPQLALSQWYMTGRAAPRKVIRVDPAWVHGRGQNQSQFKLFKKTIAIFGCGALGSHLAIRLAQAGVGGMILVDPEVLESANVGRHALGMSYLGNPKAKGLAYELLRRFPEMRTAKSLVSRWESIAPESWSEITRADLIVATIADWGAEGPLNAFHLGAAARPPIVYGWMEEHATAGHALAIQDVRGCLQCVMNPDGTSREPETIWGPTNTVPEPACGVFYAPFGPVELSYSEGLVSDLVLDVLLGNANGNVHRIYATSEGRLLSLGGQWSEAHRNARPSGFLGHLIFERQFVRNSDCPICAQYN